MRCLIFVINFLVVIGVSIAGEFELVSDDVLDSVYAQGYDEATLGGVSDIVNNGDLGNFVGDNAIVVSFPETWSMDGHLVISDNGQQNAFNPVNASDAAVNNMYNILIFVNSNLNNVNINLSNMGEAVNGSMLVY